ncbi:MAG: potassium-transporting ATPase subunit KdpC [Pseudobdellovibrionaceae bacterium]
MKYLMPAIRFKIFMIILTGILYPFAMTGMAQIIFPRQASGDFVKRGDKVVGSILIAQNFEKPEYFWPRPSAIGFNPLPSGGSNLGQASQDLKKAVDERRNKLKSAHSDQSGEPPQDLLFASGSGLDPHISIEGASYQAQRVAKNRHMDIDQVQKLIQQATNERLLGIFGEPTVNVLALNLALDAYQVGKTQETK